MPSKPSTATRSAPSRCAPRGSCTSTAWSRSSAGASSRGPSPSRPTPSPSRPSTPSRHPSIAWRSSRCRRESRARPPRATRSPTADPFHRSASTPPPQDEEHHVFSNVKNMFKIPDLRGKILFTLAVIALYRFGAHIPTPGVDFQAVEELTAASERGGVLGFLNLFSGGALTRFAIFGLGIMPYITASIIMQVLAVVIPKLEEWQDQGAVGQKKITQWTRYLTVALALMQSTGLAFLFHNGGGGLFGTQIDLIPDFTIPRVLLIVLSLTAGTALLMWMGELITQRGVGNGMSLLIFASVVSRIPFEGGAVRAENGNLTFILVIALAIAVLVAIVFIEQGQR